MVQRPKETRLGQIPLWSVYDCIQAVAGEDPSAIVLDFFAGSGTTGHAVWELNKDDGGHRRFILVQLPESISEAGPYRTIADVTKARLRAASQSVKSASPLFAGDLGFRVFKLDSSNIRAWEPDRENLDQTVLNHHEHLKADRTEADILYELLLKLGLDLCVPIEQKEIAGKAVHSIGGGVLVACLAIQITGEEVEPLAQGIVAWHQALKPAGDTTCVFRDSAFANDVAKTNLAAILYQHGLGKVRSL
jgi:adenine-specific DNA-methyltransferase